MRRDPPRADPRHPSAELAYGVWERVYGTFYAVTGRQTEVVVLADGARLSSGQPFPANAFICPSTSAQAPTLYITWPLVSLVRAQRLYDVDFLALVIGHELGHRVNDFDWEGRVTTTPGAKNVEARADARGAFFAAVAGYATRRLACDDALDLFLDVEADVPDDVRKGRKLALAEVLRTFDVYESLYDATASLVFWDSFKAKKLIAWVERHLERHVQPIPEIKVLAAITTLMDGADKSCWTSQTAVPDAPAAHLRCMPVYPAHTAFWDDASAYTLDTRSCGGPIDTEVEGAVKLLRRALDEGADALVVHNALACAYAYLGKPELAGPEIDKAVARLSPKSPAAVRAALASNRAFIAWVPFIATSGIPSTTASASERGAWARKVTAEAPKFAAHAGITAWFGRLKTYPRPPPTPAKAPLQCRVEPPAPPPGVGWSMLPLMPREARSGGCPCGWSELHFLDNDDGDRAGDGIRTCVPAGWAVGQRYIDIDLEREQVADTRLLVFDVLEGSVANLRSWERGCKQLEDRGIGSDGKRVVVGVCPELGAPEVILSADDCRVTRAVVHQGP